MRAAGNSVSSGKARFLSELESDGTVQKRVWVQGIFLMTDQYRDKELSDEI